MAENIAQEAVNGTKAVGETMTKYLGFNYSLFTNDYSL
jgi:hypothetical protein